MNSAGRPDGYGPPGPRTHAPIYGGRDSPPGFPTRSGSLIPEAGRGHRSLSCKRGPAAKTPAPSGDTSEATEASEASPATAFTPATIVALRSAPAAGPVCHLIEATPPGPLVIGPHRPNPHRLDPPGPGPRRPTQAISTSARPNRSPPARAGRPSPPSAAGSARERKPTGREWPPSGKGSRRTG